MLRDPAIELLQIRNAEAGCFIARVERVQPNRPDDPHVGDGPA